MRKKKDEANRRERLKQLILNVKTVFKVALEKKKKLRITSKVKKTT